jgi:nicotinamide-nucleotide amidase
MTDAAARAAIVSVGDELLAGRVVDTNASWASARLREEGFPVALRLAVGDDEAAIAWAVRQAFDAAPVVVVGGGIGPTRDDVTRGGVAGALNAPVAEHAGALALIRATYSQRGLPMPAGSETQALMPAGAEPVPNGNGTAPGILWRGSGRAEGRVLIVVPGVPAEFRSMIESALVPILRARADRGGPPVSGAITLAGMREVDVGRTVADLMDRGRDPLVGSYPKRGRVVLFAESRAGGSEGARRVEDALAEIERRLGDFVVGRGDLLLEEVVAGLLLSRGLTVAVAESLTGGLVADGLVEVPGVSKAFLAGFVAYANRAKTQVLGVPEALLAKHGAVSEECVRAMAEGARARSGADLAIALTGIAGPSGGSEDKPVGTTWFGLADANGTVAARVVFPGDRAAVRAYARARAFDFMRRRLLGLPLFPPRPAP